MRLPRDLSGEELARLLARSFGYNRVRQRGSHLTLVVHDERGMEHHLTIPMHRSVSVGTLGALVSTIAEHLDLSRDQVRKRLFDE